MNRSFNNFIQSSVWEKKGGKGNIKKNSREDEKNSLKTTG